MSSALDTTAIRAQFPILEREVHGKPLVYLDHAASAQKPIAVIEAQREYLMHYHANVHRGVHALSQQATDAFERAVQRCNTTSGRRIWRKLFGWRAPQMASIWLRNRGAANT